MDRQRVLLLENDAALKGLLRELFEGEDLDVTACESLTELQACISQHPRAIVVSDSWAPGEYLTLSQRHRAEIVGLANSVGLILTTGRSWAKHIVEGELGTAVIVEKPFELDRLLAAVRAVLGRSAALAGAPDMHAGVATSALTAPGGADTAAFPCTPGGVNISVAKNASQAGTSGAAARAKGATVGA
jgi:DNA-binding response OmpR family regulator